MTDLRKAAELAATNLEELIHWYGIRDSKDKLMPAHNQTPEIKSAMESFEALRQALDYPTPEQIALAQQIRPKGKSRIGQALAQPEQKYDYRIKYDRPCYKCQSNFCPGNCKEPEHLAEPEQKKEWVGLTDEDWNRSKHNYEFQKGVDWAEAKLKEKNT